MKHIDSTTKHTNKYLPKVVFALLLWTAAVLLTLLARFVPGFAEGYASTIYPLFTGTVGRIIGLLPFSVAEILLYVLIFMTVVSVIVCLIHLLACLFSGAPLLSKTIAVLAVRIACVTGVLALAYVAFCGINYHRSTFAENIGLMVSPSSKEELADLYASLAESINADSAAVARDEEGIFDIGLSMKDCRKACVTAMESLGQDITSLDSFYPQPKPILLWQLLSYQNVTGVYSPFTIEANYNRDIPSFTLPFTICHELSHLTGFMREDEANFIGWLACASSDEPWLRYSGNLTAFITVGNALYATDAEAWRQVYGGLCHEAKVDLQENNEYWKRFEGKVAETHEKVNNAYLKANGQTDGVKSYGRMVDLMLAWRRENRLIQ